MTSSTYSPREEWLNCAVHVVGIAASLLTLPVLVLTARRTGDPWLLVGGLTFVGATLYSTHYKTGPKRKIA